MRTAYLECFSGMSGDMFLGALVDAGVAPQTLEATVVALNVGARLEISRVVRSGISATKVDVWVDGEKDLPREEYWEQRRRQHGHEHAHDSHHEHEHPEHSHSHAEISLAAATDRYRRKYDTELAPVFRSSSRIRQLLALPQPVRRAASHLLERTPAVSRFFVKMTR